MGSLMVLDLNQNVQESETSNSDSHHQYNNEIKKTCTDCHTTKTPCWRSGPAGPKTLCNACGIRHRKKARMLVGLEEQRNNRRKIAKSNGSKFKLGLRISGRDNNKVGGGEEEQAAFLLMALSYGCISALDKYGLRRD
ncbi:GATA transcription factor 15 [Euphorbia peplus]|nr:GATA transcription factor 15 [Euphorbia peplus]